MFIRRDEHQMDKHFRKHLYDASEDVPMHLWEGIRRKNNKRRRFIFWLSLAASLLIGSFITYQLLEQPGETASVPTTDVNPKNSIEQTNTSSDKGESSGLNPTDNSSVSTAPKESNQTAEQKTQPLNNTNNKTEKKEITDRPIDRNDKSSPKNFIPKEPSIKNSGVSQAPDKSSREKERVKSSDTVTMPFVTSSGTNSVADDRSKTPDHITDNVYHNSAEHIDQSEGQSPMLSSGSSLTAIEEEIMRDDQLPLVTKNSSSPTPIQKNIFSIGVYGLLTTPHHTTVKGTDMTTFKSLIGRTDTRYGKGVGLSANYSPIPHLNIGLGIESYSFDEVHSWDDTTGTYGYYQNATTYVVVTDTSSAPVEVTVIDTVYEENLIIRRREQRNVYSSINVPLLFGYQNTKNKFSYGIEIGPVFRIDRGYRGGFVFPAASLTEDANADANISTNEPLSFGSDAQVNLASYYSDWKIDVHVGLNAGYFLSKNLQASLGLFYRQSTVIIDKNNPLAHRMIQPGARLGLVYSF
jgi:hypothetical protein